MTKPREVIDWQFNDLYYKMLVNQLNTIRYLIVYWSNYEKAFKEMQQIFNNISSPIKKHNLDKHTELVEQMKEIYKNLHAFQRAHHTKAPRRIKAINLSKTKQKLEMNINEFHQNLMATMDNMNMIFKRKERGNPNTAIFNAE